jgi:ABC-type lipoprotein export system ATPase subunit
VLLAGHDLGKLDDDARTRLRREKIGFVFQFFNLLPRLTIMENVALPLFYKGIGTRRRMKQALNMLERVGLSGKEFFYPRHLSGGQAQCVAIARALVNNPSVIIADEPTGNLDSSASRLIMELLSEIHKTGNTILFVTHNPELTRYATRVVYMHDGQVVHDEETALGDIAPTARKVMYTIPVKTEDDDLAGVSTLMKVTPGGDKSEKARTSAKAAAKKPGRKTSKSRAKKGAHK